MGTFRRPFIRTAVLDATALSTAADPASAVRRVLRTWQDDGADLITTATTLTEVLRGHSRDVAIHRLLASLRISVVDEHLGRAAGERIGRRAVRGDVTVDAIVAEVASNQPRPVVVVTSDIEDITALVDEDVLIFDINGG